MSCSLSHRMIFMIFLSAALVTTERCSLRLLLSQDSAFGSKYGHHSFAIHLNATGA